MDFCWQCRNASPVFSMLLISSKKVSWWTRTGEKLANIRLNDVKQIYLIVKHPEYQNGVVKQSVMSWFPLQPRSLPEVSGGDKIICPESFFCIPRTILSSVAVTCPSFSKILKISHDHSKSNKISPQRRNKSTLKKQEASSQLYKTDAVHVFLIVPFKLQTIVFPALILMAEGEQSILWYLTIFDRPLCLPVGFDSEKGLLKTILQDKTPG